MPGINMMPSGSTLQIPLDACTGFSAKAGNAQVTLTWTDPKDKYATPEGETAQDPDQLVSVWDHTVLVRKTGSQPAGPNDGTVVVSSSVRDQYASAGYVDTGLTNDVTYYYAVFAYNTDGVASEGAFTSATPMAGTPLFDLVEGTLIKILENGAPVEFYVAKQDYESGLNGMGRVLCVRKNDIGQFYWVEEPNGYKTYSSSTIDSTLNNSYKQRFSQNVQTMMATTTFQYVSDPPSRRLGNLARSIFLPSSDEWGVDRNLDGTEIPLLATLRSSLSSNWHWTRSQTSDYDVYYVMNSGGGAWGGRFAETIIPAFTLPSTAFVDQYLNLIES